MTVDNAAEAKLYRLVYYSRNRVAQETEATAAEIDDILAASRRNNARVGVTGALIFNSGVFAQVLEGALPDIEATFERIQRDQRHGDVEVLQFEPTATRAFPTWSMGFIGRSQKGKHLFGHVTEATGFEAKRLEGERIFDIMRAIAIDEERAPAA
ncbi:BLUF domain-containing protein [Hansschlegelia quercus]|uniref:BLUF domain-containing protein n=1 Tax=Hansschlegelia quercus TaxID=2528245 RepID=A0A4Q9GQ46_9HYPH|nr:BLUF domain-containing protein [Hansschlegelia quercus]TBN54924.1 BLUF domain-containing protein [Hansschlegelia quercus]